MSSMGTFNFVSIETLTGNTGGKIHAVASNISILGAGGLKVAGNAALGTLTISGPGGPTGNLMAMFTTDVGGNVVPTILGAVDFAGGNNITISGSVLNTATFHLTGTTEHAVQLGNATGSLTSLAVGTAAYVLTSNGAGSDPSWQASVNSVTGGTNISTSGTAADPVIDLDATITLTTVNATTFDTNIAAAGVTLAGTSLLADGTDADIDINITSKGAGHVVIDDLQLTTDLAVTEGGTGVSTLTDHGVLLGAGAAAITSLAVGTATYVLTSNGAGVDPSWQANASGSVNSVTGGTNISTSGTAADPVVDLDDTITLTTVNSTTFDTNVAAAGVTLAGTSLLADGTDADIDINITAKGTGHVIIDDLQLTTDLAVTEGGTGASTLTDHSVLLGSGTDAITSLTVGAAGEILTGVLNSDPAWLAAGTADQVLTAHGAASAVTWETPSDLLTINAQVGTTYTLALTDSSKLITLSNASPITLTIPLNSSVAFSIGTQILLNQLGAGNVTVAATGGVTINSYDSDVVLSGQHSVAGLIKIGTDLWLLFGDIA